jgi:hypothetical protein
MRANFAVLAREAAESEAVVIAMLWCTVGSDGGRAGHTAVRCRS